jgi:putative ABC transport system permease protein
MTIAMFSLVIFSLIMIATLNANFSKVFINDDATAGWDIQGEVSESNPIPDLNSTLAQSEVDTSQIGSLGRRQHPTSSSRESARRVGSSFESETVSGLDQTFLNTATLLFERRAAGYESNEAIIEALKTEPGVAVVSSPNSDEDVLGIDPEANGFAPIPIEVRNSATGEIVDLRVIGVIDSKISTIFFLGVFANDASLAPTFPEMRHTDWFIKAAPGVNDRRLADEVETVLLRYGADTRPIREELEEQQRLSNGFIYLVQGFMGLGLIVGIAAIGVVSFRSVVERRQQIGVLRAIGFQREMVSLSFLIESAFVVGVGAIAGTILGLALAYNLLNSDDVSSSVGFVIPWGTVLAIFFGTMIVALLMSWVPSRQAAGIAPAEALRYE